MKPGTRFAVTVLTVACASTVYAAEVMKPTETKDFLKNAALTAENGAFSVKGQSIVFSAQTFPVDLSKKYRISGNFRAKPGTEPTVFYFGFAPYNEKNAPIIPRMVCFFPDTLTELAEPAKAGDTVLKVKDASKWNKPSKYPVVAFNAKPDFSDLPSKDFVDAVPGKIESKDGVWEISLKAPLKKAYAKGTMLRQHTDSGTFIYTGASNRKNSADWQKFSGEISGLAKNGNTATQWWPGTKKARIVLLLNYGGKNAPVAEFKDIVVETVD